MKNRSNFTLRLTLLIFLTMLASSFIVAVLVYISINFLKLSLFRNPFGFLVLMLLTSTILGSILSYFISNRSMKLLKEIVDTINKVGQGDFNVSLNETKFNQFNSIIKNFNVMVKELNSIETLLSDFIANFSHEFKTPIVSIRGFAKLLKKQNLSEEEKEEYLNIIISEANRLVLLSSNTLFLTKLESQEIVPEKNNFLLDEQIREIILLFQNSWEQKKINLKLDLEEVRFYGNKELIHQIWINLFSNAVKFSKENGDIAISLKQDSKKIYFAITDNGSGMSEETLKHVFDKFYQGDYSRSTSGNGLGMSIVKRIIDLTNGTIEISSSLDVGTSISVTLPKLEIGNEKE